MTGQSGNRVDKARDIHHRDDGDRHRGVPASWKNGNAEKGHHYRYSGVGRRRRREVWQSPKKQHERVHDSKMHADTAPLATVRVCGREQIHCAQQEYEQIFAMLLEKHSSDERGERERLELGTLHDSNRSENFRNVLSVRVRASRF